MRPLVVANWKMHGDTAFVQAFASAWRDVRNTCEIVLCPPWPYLPLARSLLENTGVGFGVQNVGVAPSGAFTGEQAAEMGRDLGASYAIVGHSERRRLFAETNAVAAAKFCSAQRAGLTPILCVGETSAQRRAGDAEATVLAQLRAVADAAGVAAFEKAVVAYEPVWAIGSGETATPAQAQAMHAAIRGYLATTQAPAATTRILYGGSVTANNASALFAERDIDGGLVGGASLDAGAFAAICCAAAPWRDPLSL